ncbi:MAG TPA: hypothetical protein PKI14_08195 [Fervidobacterium sp.]|nr:hypothetical protein [Fervidobacterium sp.]HOM73783.1 hypothetical protein [Fervidobacterium sp.]HOQ40066.1 hypothetical protein [Fervidobacterium sp.]HPP18031.1 hypothetical protein [Fervidobacterium sp.]HPT54515.1 hypothetical protein [Fervidobacterium sp.]
MRKRAFVAVFAILLSQIVLGAMLQDFAYLFLIEQKVPESHAKLLAQTLEEEAEHIPESVDPLLMLAFGLSETNFMNVFGDSGKAVGYFQLHENAVFYVANFYDDVKEFKKQNRNHVDLIKHPDWQLRIAYRYMYLTLKNVHNWDIIKAISSYNGRSDKYNIYVVNFFRNYAMVVEKYLDFSNKNASNVSKSTK